jgi:hypothetical protein
MEFIAYDREKKEWIDPDDVFINGDGRIFFGECAHWGYDIDVVSHIDIYPYIGRKDKDGNKIYEGSKLLTNEAGWIGDVVFHNAIFYLMDINGGFSSEPEWNKCKIIGHTAIDGPTGGDTGND